MTLQVTKGKLRLAGFVIASACIHLAIVLAMKGPHASIDLGDANSGFIAVEMQEASPARTAGNSSHKSGKTAEASARTQAAAQKHDSAAKPNQDKQASRLTQDHRQAILGRISRDISRYFYYPPQALRRGWEGTVLVRLRLLPSGKIESVRLSSGSGHSILDRAAIDSVERIRQIAMSDLGVSTTLDLQIPVIYRLRGG